MPDNMNVIDANGDIVPVATDQVGMAHIQKIKILDGTPDSGTPIQAGGGPVANALRVVQGQRISVFGIAETDIVDTTPVALIAAPGAGLSIFITTILITNSHETIGTVVKLVDGGSGGEILFRNYAAEKGGFSVQLLTPIEVSENAALYIVCETTGAAVQASILGYKE